jgi:hypothetical protein
LVFFISLAAIFVATFFFAGMDHPFAPGDLVSGLMLLTDLWMTDCI